MTVPTGKLHPSKRRVTVVLTKATWKALRQVALKDDTSASAIVEEALLAYLDDSSGVRAAIERWKAKHE